MKGMDEVKQNGIWFHWRQFIERCISHITSDDMMLFPWTEIHVALIFCTKGFVGNGITSLTLNNPKIHIVCLGINILEIKIHTARTVILRQEIVCRSIPTNT